MHWTLSHTHYFGTGEKLLVKEDLAKRWTKPYEDFRMEVVCTETTEPEIHVLERTTPRRKKPVSESKRYTVSLKLTTEIAEAMSLTGGAQFKYRIKNLEALLSYWRSGQEVVIQPKIQVNSAVNGK